MNLTFKLRLSGVWIPLFIRETLRRFVLQIMEKKKKINGLFLSASVDLEEFQLFTMTGS